MAVIIKECTDYIIASGQRENFRDAANLLRNTGYGSEEEICSKVTGTAFIRQIEEVPDIGSLEHDEKTDCEYIREKYSLYSYDICRVCAKCSSFTPGDENREKQLMRAMFSSPVTAAVFSTKPGIHEHILDRFMVYTPYRSENKLNSYAMVNRMLYETLYSMLQEGMYGKKDRTTPVRDLIPPDQLYERWKFLYYDYCDEQHENSLVRTTIDFYYENGYDKDDAFDYYLPDRKARKRKKEETEPETVTAEKTVREQAIELDDLNVLFGGKAEIDRRPPFVAGDRTDALVPTFTEEELDIAGFIRPSEDILNSIGYESIRKGLVSMDVIRIRGTEKPLLMLCIKSSYRCILKPEQLDKLSVFLETRRNAVTKEPVSLFKFMRMNGRTMKLTIFRPADRDAYLGSVMEGNGKQFSQQAYNDKEIMYQKAYSYSMSDSLDNLETEDHKLVIREPLKPDETKNILRAEIKTVLSPTEWIALRKEIPSFLAEKNQFEIQGMSICSIKDETKEFIFMVDKEKCRGFSSILTRTISEYIRKLGYYPDVTYTVE